MCMLGSSRRHRFATAVETLSQLKFINLEVERVYATPRGRNEFTAVLRKVTT